MKIIPIKLQAGNKYSILLESEAFDSFLRLIAPDGKLLAEDDDSGGNLNARIDHQAKVTGAYGIVLTSFDGKLGPFHLTVLWDKGKKGEKARQKTKAG